MNTKKVIIEGKEVELLPYKDNWIFPQICYYQTGLGSPVALILHSLENNRFEEYSVVTVNLPEYNRSAGCQFIDINNNGEDIVQWLEDNKLGKCTDRNVQSGFCTYPEFDFYKGEKFFIYKEISDNLKKDITHQIVQDKEYPKKKTNQIKRKL